MLTLKEEHGGLLKMAKFITLDISETMDNRQVYMIRLVLELMVCLEYLLTQVLFGIAITKKLFIWFLPIIDIQLYGLLQMVELQD